MALDAQIIRDIVERFVSQANEVETARKSLEFLHDEFRKGIKNSDNLREKKALRCAQFSIMDCLDHLTEVEKYLTAAIKKERVTRHPRYRRELRAQIKRLETDGTPIDETLFSKSAAENENEDGDTDEGTEA